MRWKRWVVAVVLLALVWFVVPRLPLVGALFHFSHKVLIYGKVVDQHGDPVPKAEITVYYLDSFFGDGKHFTQYADANGLFTVQGFRGNSVTVNAGKKGYLKYSESWEKGAPDSTGKVYYGERTTRMNPREDPADPMVLTLFKLAPGVPLTLRGRDRSELIKMGEHGGNAFAILESGSSRRHAIEITFSSEEKLPGRKPGDPFGWEIRFQVAGGGLVERTGELDFVAPTEGYQTPIIHSYVPGNLNDPLIYGFKRSYFVRFEDGSYGRWNVEVSRNGNVRWSSALNPYPGSTNLSPLRPD